MSLPYNGKNIHLAKLLRRRATPQERHLWYDFLSHYPIRFQRQKVIGEYIVDFYCHQARLVIEIDGAQHFQPGMQESDADRTNALKTMGLSVLRFDNMQIDRQFPAVCETIDRTVRTMIADS